MAKKKKVVKKTFERRTTREPVIGFTIYETETGRTVEPREVDALPINVNWEGLSDENCVLPPTAKVYGTIQAPAKSFRVLAMMPDESWEFLGYDFFGAFSPDWEELYTERLANWHTMMDMRKRRKK